jgi:hypothetical protein
MEERQLETFRESRKDPMLAFVLATATPLFDYEDFVVLE